MLIAGKALARPMIRRLLLPLKDDDHMPPEGKPQPALAGIAALERWLDCGAPPDAKISDLKQAGVEGARRAPLDLAL